MIEGRGDQLKCYLDGKLVIEAKDSVIKCGAAGLRTAGMSAIKDVKVTTDKAGWENIIRFRKDKQAKLEEARKSVPQMKLAKKITFPFP